MNKEPENHHFNATHNIELVIFDCDGVLVDSEVIAVDLLLSELRAIDVNLSVDYFNQHFLGRSFANVKNKIFDSYQVVLAADFEANFEQRLLKVFETKLQPTPGIRLVLEKLDIAYCVATSSSPTRTQKALQLTDLSDLCAENVFTASQVKHGKPAPDLFLFAAAKMGVKPENCLVIEDSISGLQAAQAAGMLVWQYIGGSHMTAATPSSPDTNNDDNLCSSIARFSNWQNFYKMADELKQVS